ncbi:E3 ubiquitin-protein ligase UPL6-like [Dendrobium catenatum]|uniref:E3 ubiquitin-protein ligase UPL6-like n=1 Tax=Dendrobium catenatum TaxID=906689 RepID=UPI00109F2470|nr:E3 ubiquitin-protein ligase UPL6-like [Dendrobium catenatum]
MNIVGANILVDNKGCIKLADFGASKQVAKLATMTAAKSMNDTAYWMAPEVILQIGHTLEVLKNQLLMPCGYCSSFASEDLPLIACIILRSMANALFKDTSLSRHRYESAPSDEAVEAIGSICAFLHVKFNTLPSERILTGLAYGTDLVLIIWSFIKYCQENQTWPLFTKLIAYILVVSPRWLLSLPVFCPVYKYMLTIMDNEEFFEQERPISLSDIRLLVIILKQASWHVFWVVPATMSSLKLGTDFFANKFSVETI